MDIWNEDEYVTDTRYVEDEPSNDPVSDMPEEFWEE